MAKQQGEEGDVLPPEVRKQVEEAKAEAENEETVALETEPAPLPEPEETKESRRARRERERQEERQAILDRAEAAQKVAEELRAARIEDAARLSRLETMLAERAQPRTEEKQTDWRETYDRQMKKAKEALAAGNLDDYHERLERALGAKHRAEAVEQARQFIPQQQQAAPQKPVWASAIESQFPDVVTHANGLNAVAAFAQMDPSPLNAEKLQRAFTRARQELGLAKASTPDPNRERQRQMLASGPTNGSTRGNSSGRERVVNGVPKNYKEIARAAGMSPEAYLKSFIKMNPGSVSGGE